MRISSSSGSEISSISVWNARTVVCLCVTYSQPHLRILPALARRSIGMHAPASIPLAGNNNPSTQNTNNTSISTASWQYPSYYLLHNESIDSSIFLTSSHLCFDVSARDFAAHCPFRVCGTIAQTNGDGEPETVYIWS